MRYKKIENKDGWKHKAVGQVIYTQRIAAQCGGKEKVDGKDKIEKRT